MSHRALGGQFDVSSTRVEHFDRSPLDYSGNNRWGQPRRIALMHPDVPDPRPGDLGFSEIARTVRVGRNGRPLKTPRREVVTPPGPRGMVAFADVSDQPGGGVLINYLRTRSDMRGQGLASRLVEHVYDQNPRSVDWGKVMNEDAARLMEKFKDRRPDVPVRYKKYW